MENRIKKQIDRCGMISLSFAQAYYGHVSIDSATWSELELFCDIYLSSATRDKSSHAEVDELQGRFAEVMESHPLHIYPTTEKHRKQVVQWIRLLFERNQIPIGNEKLKTILSSQEESNESLESVREPEFMFKSFYNNTIDDFVTILEENKNLIAHGTTGLTSWQGALCLSDWCLNKPELFKGKNVIELGSGTGLLGISLMKSLEILNYKLTDCHHNVMNALIYNIKLNFNRTTEESQQLEERLDQGPPEIVTEDTLTELTFAQQISNEREIMVQHLDWLDFQEDKLVSYDILLGSDIVYARALLPALSRVINLFLSMSDDRKAFIACTERSYTTLDCFESALKSETLNFKVVYKIMYSPTDTIMCSHKPIRIYEIFK